MDITGFIVSRRDKALSVGDYGLYKQQLARRLHVLRRKLHHVSKNTTKYSPARPITSAQLARKPEFVYLVLLCAERGWAYAMHVKAVQQADGKLDNRKRASKRQIATKLLKAARHADKLTTLLAKKNRSKASLNDVLEARAYAAAMHGALSFEKEQWDDALQWYCESRLLHAVVSANGDVTKREQIRTYLETNIDPSIRYSSYRLNVSRNKSIEDIALEYVHAGRNEYTAEAASIQPDIFTLDKPGNEGNIDDLKVEVPTNIQWRGRKVPLEDSVTAQAMAKATGAHSRLSQFLAKHRSTTPKAKAAAYDEVLSASQDAVDASKSALDEALAGGTTQSDPRVQGLQITRTALSLILIERRIGRNRVLCGKSDGIHLDALREKTFRRREKQGKLTKARKSHSNEPVESLNHTLQRLKQRNVLYDGILQSLDAAKSLPGVAANQTLSEELTAKQAYFSGLRCLGLAQAHSATSRSKNALALAARGLEHLQSHSNSSAFQGAGDATASKTPSLFVSRKQFENACTTASNFVLQYRAHCHLADLQAEAALSSARRNVHVPLIERLHEYPAEPVDLNNLVTLPPKLQPIPVKPIFLDIAFNYINYPGAVSAEADQVSILEDTPVSFAMGEKQPAAKKGWFSFGRG